MKFGMCLAVRKAVRRGPLPVRAVMFGVGVPQSSTGMAEGLRQLIESSTGCLNHVNTAQVKFAMSKNQRSNGNLKELTDAEILAVIRYLDPDVKMEGFTNGDSSLLVICIGFLALLFGLAAIVWLHCRSQG